MKFTQLSGRYVWEFPDTLNSKESEYWILSEPSPSHNSL